MITKKKKIITHNGSFHADDVFASAVISLVLENENFKYEIIRTRDSEVIKKGDFVFDVGGVYDPDKNRYDHHQKGGAGKRPNKIPYASFGLVWKHFGLKLCGGNKNIWQKIDNKLACPIDAIDNGVDFAKYLYKDIGPDSLAENFLIYSPTWKEGDDGIDKVFLNQVRRAKEFLKREIQVMKDDQEAEDIILKTYQKSKDKRIIVLKNSFPRYLYQRILSMLDEPIYVIYPSSHSNGYGVEAIRKSPETMDSRKSFPESWRGFLNNQENKIEIKNKIGISGVLFTHQNGFLAHLENKKQALAFAKKALEI